ncbi:MAG TPA: hypothetical protein PKD53_00465 [Chloroflexaceae bacterium]|nr:hypothetical protein [Chloroflexaceae bacterium]
MSPLARCLRLLDLYLAREAPPWRPRQPYGPPPDPLTPAELHRLWRATLAEHLGPAPAGFTPLAAAIGADAAEALAATARVIALLQEPPS